MHESALQTLEAAIAGKSTVQTGEVRAALILLRDVSPDRSGLDWYWDAAGGTEPIGRRANLRAALNRIRLILAGWRQDGSPCGLLKRAN